DLREPIGPADRYVTAPATTVYRDDYPSYVYAGPVYYGGYYGYNYPYYSNYCGSRYYGSSCYPSYYGGSYCRPGYGGYSSFGLNYSNFGHHSGFGVHLGGRF